MGRLNGADKPSQVYIIGNIGFSGAPPPSPPPEEESTRGARGFFRSHLGFLWIKAGGRGGGSVGCDSASSS